MPALLRYCLAALIFVAACLPDVCPRQAVGDAKCTTKRSTCAFVRHLELIVGTATNQFSDVCPALSQAHCTAATAAAFSSGSMEQADSGTTQARQGKIQGIQEASCRKARGREKDGSRTAGSQRRPADPALIQYPNEAKHVHSTHLRSVRHSIPIASARNSQLIAVALNTGDQSFKAPTLANNLPMK